MPGKDTIRFFRSSALVSTAAAAGLFLGSASSAAPSDGSYRPAPVANRSPEPGVITWAPMNAQSSTARVEDDSFDPLCTIDSSRDEQGEILLNAEDFAKLEALLEDESGPTPAMLELFRKA